MKIYLSKIKESWIIDRVRDEWYENNRNISTKIINNSDLVWIIAPWVWRKVPVNKLKQRKVVCSIYHINPKEFDVNEFRELEQHVDSFHVISELTKKDLKKFTDKPITSIPLWIDGSKFFHIEDKEMLRKKYNIEEFDYVVGSFQRDTEGKDLISPKLIKGPDVFINIIKQLFEDNKNLLVLLTGKRRQYVINELNKIGVRYLYLEMVNFKVLNELYNLLDLYIVSSRIEGGPQSILECAVSKTPIVSTRVGVAEEILNPKSIYDFDSFKSATPDTDFAYKNIEKFIIPKGMEKYKSMFKDVLEN